MLLPRFKYLFAVTVSLFVIGCTVQAPTVSEPSTVPSPVPTTSINPDVSVDEPQLGYIKRFFEENGKQMVEIDPAKWLTGTEANEAMLADGACAGWESTCSAPNGFYLRNQNDVLITYALASDAQFEVIDAITDTSQGGTTMLSLAQFQELLNAPFAENQPYYSQGHYLEIPFTFMVSDGYVTLVQEHYVP